MRINRDWVFPCGRNCSQAFLDANPKRHRHIALATLENDPTASIRHRDHHANVITLGIIIRTLLAHWVLGGISSLGASCLFAEEHAG